MNIGSLVCLEGETKRYEIIEKHFNKITGKIDITMKLSKRNGNLLAAPFQEDPRLLKRTNEMLLRRKEIHALREYFARKYTIVLDDYEAFRRELVARWSIIIKKYHKLNPDFIKSDDLLEILCNRLFYGMDDSERAMEMYIWKKDAREFPCLYESINFSSVIQPLL